MSGLTWTLPGVTVAPAFQPATPAERAALLSQLTIVGTDDRPNDDITVGSLSDASGCFNFVWTADGDVSFDDSQTHLVFVSLFDKRGEYPFDANQGSEITKQRSITSRTASQAEAFAHDALGVAEKLGLLIGLRVVARVDRKRGREFVDVFWKSPSGADAAISELEL